MKKFIAAIAVLLIQCSCIHVFAQGYPKLNEPGRFRNADITGALKTAPELNKLTAKDKAIATANLTRQHQFFMNTDELKTLAGSEVRLYGYAKPKTSFQELITYEMRMMLFPFLKDSKTGKIVPVDESPAIIRIYTNSDVIRYNADFEDRCAKANVSFFFEKPQITDSNSLYIELKDDKYYTNRILQLNNKQYYLPLSRKEFLEFLIADNMVAQKREKESMDHWNENIKFNKDGLKKASSAEDKKLYEGYLKDAEYNLTVTQSNIKKFNDELQKVKDELQHLTSDQANSAVYINQNKTGSLYEKLAPSGKREGKAFWKINPGYFDKSKPASAQLMMVEYWVSHLSSNVKWLNDEMKNLYNQMDYEALRKEMK